LNWTLTELKKSVLLISKQDRRLETLSRSSLESSGGRPISLLFQNCWIRFLDQNFKIWESARVQTPVAIDPTGNLLEVAGVTFSDSDPAPAAKFLNPGLETFKMSDSDFCSDSGSIEATENCH